ncbi:hypothetical protein [Aquimarina sp. 2304DJ70-9]|uniref:hypothetical protein n=1 Tax=Aquimarina penaris TaxID=3231044 RepID=UPI0034619EF8
MKNVLLITSVFLSSMINAQTNTFPTNGNVGVGTANPEAKLQIQSSGAHHSSSPSVRIKDLTNRATMFLESLTDNPTDFVFKNNNRLSWSMSTRASTDNYSLHFFPSTNGTTWGSPTLSLLTNGNVGIGTITPQSKLEIKNGTQGVRFLTGTNTSGYVLDIGVNDDGVNFSNNSTIRGFNFKNANGGLLKITSNGNIGVGTTSPASRLDILTNAGQTESFARFKVHDAPNDYFQILNSTGAANQFIPLIKGHHESDNRYSLQIQGVATEVNDSGTNALVNFDARRTNGPIQTRPLFIWTSYTTKMMTMTANGNLGIGITTPKAGLHVKSASIEELSTNNHDANLIIEGTGSSRSMSKGATLGFVVPANADGGNPWQQGRIMVTPDNERNAYAAGRMFLQTRYLSNGAWRWRNNLVLRSDGNVGIGTTTPDSKLAVNGKIHAKEVKVDLVGWPDYVFKDEYNLPSLKEVEQHIQEKGHLQNIPSAKEVEENGILLGEMNKKLLEKIEELTLYTIAQEKRLTHQQEINKTLEVRLAKLEALLTQE